jgi:hypothetical protein
VPSPDAAQALATGNVDSSLEIYIMGGMAIIFFMQDTAIKLKTHSIFTKLIRSVKTPYEFTINPFDAIRNPNYEKISVPRYLKKTDAMYVSKRRVVNAHEALFWLGSPKLMIRFMHFSLFCQLIWPIIFFSNYSSELNQIFPVIVCIISCLIITVNLFVLFPGNLYDLAIISNIEMMKDQKILSEVTMEYRNKADSVFCKFYRLLKSVRRSLEFDSPPSHCSDDVNIKLQSEQGEQTGFSDLIIKLVRDAYGHVDTDKMNTEGLPISM